MRKLNHLFFLTISKSTMKVSPPLSHHIQHSTAATQGLFLKLKFTELPTTQLLLSANLCIYFYRCVITSTEGPKHHVYFFPPNGLSCVFREHQFPCFEFFELGCVANKFRQKKQVFKSRCKPHISIFILQHFF